MGGAEGAGGEQEGDAGDGQAELLHQHPEEEDAVRVMDERELWSWRILLLLDR